MWNTLIKINVIENIQFNFVVNKILCGCNTAQLLISRKENLTVFKNSAKLELKA